MAKPKAEIRIELGPMDPQGVSELIELLAEGFARNYSRRRKTMTFIETDQSRP